MAEPQLTFRMPTELARRLERTARHMRRRRSEVVRLALERFLRASEEPLSVRPVERVRDLLGAIESGIPDLGQRHRRYLIERARRAR